MSDVDRYEHHPGDYQMSEYGGVYHVKSRLAAGLPPIANNADAEVIMAACITNLGATGGVIRLAPRTTFDFGDTVHVTDDIAIVGEGKSTICRPAASPFAKPLFAFDQYQGTGDRQQHNVLRNLKIDMRSYADSTAIEHYNLKVSLFEDLWIQNFKAHMLYMQGFDASSFNMWNLYRNIFFECNTATAAIELHGPYNYDMKMQNIFGTCTATPGMVIYGAGNLVVDHFHPNYATNTILLEPNGDALAGVCYNLQFYDIICDNNSGHCINIDSDSGNIRDILFDAPFFLLTADNFSLIKIDNDGVDTRRVVIRDHSIHSGSPGNYEYIVDCNVAANLDDSLFMNGLIPAGGTGAYNNVPTHMIQNDRADRTCDYQLEAGGAWVGPVWVGTPPSGWDLEMYNSNLGQYRHYTYLNGGWRYATLT